MYPDYESLEESFPQLRNEREIEEELRKAKQAHAYLTKMAESGDIDGTLREYMKAETNDFDVVESDEEDGVSLAPKKQKVDIRRRNQRRSSGSIADPPRRYSALRSRQNQDVPDRGKTPGQQRVESTRPNQGFLRRSSRTRRRGFALMCWIYRVLRVKCLARRLSFARLSPIAN